MPYPAPGVGGSVKVGSSTVLNIDVWTVTPKGNTKDTTPFGASGSWQQNTATIKEWTAKWDGRFDPSDTNGQVALCNGLLSAFTISMYVDGTHYWSGPTLYDGATFKSDVNGVVTVTYNFKGTGALVLT